MLFFYFRKYFIAFCTAVLSLDKCLTFNQNSGPALACVFKYSQNLKLNFNKLLWWYIHVILQVVGPSELSFWALSFLYNNLALFSELHPCFNSFLKFHHLFLIFQLYSSDVGTKFFWQIFYAVFCWTFSLFLQNYRPFLSLIWLFSP